MSQQYRLINGKELYDMQADPGQESDIARDNPKQVEKMRAFYEAWWTELEPTFSQTTEIYLGQPGHEKVTLTSHDWIGPGGAGGVPWNQGHIRRTIHKSRKGQPTVHPAHWAVKVITPGTYQISLRRWPEEANKPITATLPPGGDVPGSSKAFRATDGVQIAAKEAVLRIDGKEIGKKAIPANATEVTFTTELKPGSLKLSPIFLTDTGEVGAYYVIVTKK